MYKNSQYNISLNNNNHIRHLTRCDLCAFTDSDSIRTIITSIVIIDNKHLCPKIENKYCDIVYPSTNSIPHLILMDKLVVYYVVEKSMSKKENVMIFSVMNIVDRDIIKLSFKYDKRVYNLLLNDSSVCSIN